MIAEISSNSDIDVYLDEEEVERLKVETLEGVIIRISHPEKQGLITVSVDDKRTREIHPGVGVLNNWHQMKNNGEVHVFLEQYHYERFVEYGRTGDRYDWMGSKVSLFNRKKDSLFETSAKLLEYVFNDYKWKIPRQQRLF